MAEFDGQYFANRRNTPIYSAYPLLDELKLRDSHGLDKARELPGCCGHTKDDKSGFDECVGKHKYLQ